MADIKFMKTSALAALAVALAITSVSSAQTRPTDGNSENGRERGSWSRGSDSRVHGREARDDAETRGGGRTRGPGYGRDWDNGGTVSRPAQASGGATPAIPDRGRDATRHQRLETRGGGGETTIGTSRRTPSGTYSIEGNRTYSEQRRSPVMAPDRRDGRRTSMRDGWRDGRRDGGTRWTEDTHRRWEGRDWRRDSRYNWSHYRNTHRDHYRAGRYYSPYRHYSYSRLSIGIYLGSGFYARNYWIDDPWSYRLPDAYGPYRWVRYYDDVLLVDIYDGRVVDVIYDFFW